MTVSPQSLPTPHGRSDAAGRTPAPPGPAGGVNSFSRCGLEVAAGTNLRGIVDGHEVGLARAGLRRPFNPLARVIAGGQVEALEAGIKPGPRKTISRSLKLFRQRNFRSGKNIEGGRKIGIVKRDPDCDQVLMMRLAAEDGGLHQRVAGQGVIQRVPAGRWRAPARSDSSKGNNFALTRHLNTSCASEDRSDGGPDAEKFGPVLDPARSGFGHA